MEGRVGNQQGIFPINFIDIKIPLPGVPDNIVTAIYPFKGETPEDLVFDVSQFDAKLTIIICSLRHHSYITLNSYINIHYYN